MQIWKKIVFDISGAVFKNTPGTQRFKPGEMAKIVCETNKGSPSQITWQKDDKPITRSK